MAFRLLLDDAYLFRMTLCTKSWLSGCKEKEPRSLILHLPWVKFLSEAQRQQYIA